jgi:hypothetical protein
MSVISFYISTQGASLFHVQLLQDSIVWMSCTLFINLFVVFISINCPLDRNVLF